MPVKQAKPDGLYINYKLIKENATVEDFCKAQGRVVELFRYNKAVLSKGIR